MATVEVTRTYLELAGRDAHRAPARPLPVEATLVRLAPGDVAGYRALYALVGSQWHWHDRDAWPDAQLAAYLAEASVAVHVLQVRGEAAGYVELEAHAPGDVEIVYFGLAPAFLGHGLGGPFLTKAIELAWDMGATRVSLNTCTLDSPRALPNYVARGFVAVREEKYTVEL